MKFQNISTAICLTIFAALTVNIAPSSAQSGPGNYGNVNTAYTCSRDGDTINLRSRAGQQYRVLAKVRPGKAIVLVGNNRVVGEFTWQKVNYYGVAGWVRGAFLCD